MGIPRNHQSGSFIDQPGEYKVTVEKIESGKSKKGKPMLTITFMTDDEKSIKGYFVRTLDFHMKALQDIKIASGLNANSPADDLIGKRLGIAVGEQSPTEDGRIYMRIEGYGKESEVDGGGSGSQQGHATQSDRAQTEDDLPW